MNHTRVWPRQFWRTLVHSAKRSIDESTDCFFLGPAVKCYSVRRLFTSKNFFLALPNRQTSLLSFHFPFNTENLGEILSHKFTVTQKYCKKNFVSGLETNGFISITDHRQILVPILSEITNFYPPLEIIRNLTVFWWFHWV